MFHDTPVRGDDYTSITGSIDFPLSFCATRRVEDQPVADRLISILDNIVSLVRHWKKLSKSKQPSSKSFINVQKACNDKFTILKLHFFRVFLQASLSRFLTSYQTDWPMILFLYTDLTDLVMKILELFVKPDYEFKYFELRKVENILKLSSIKLGFSAERLLARMKERDEASDNQIKQFRKDCQTFLVGTIV